MAFRMNRPVIKGTANHKASIAKAKATSVVSQSRTKGDAGLIAAANTLGESYKPQAIDFELDKIDIDVPEKKEKKEKQPKVKKEKKVKVKKEKKVKVKKEKEVLTEEEQAAKDAAEKDAAKKEARFNELMVEDEEENDFSAIDNEPDVNYESSGGVDRGYKTWKHKQDAENIRLAEKNKASVSAKLQAAKDAGWTITDSEIGEMAREATTWNEDKQRWEATPPKTTIKEVAEAAGDGGGAADEAKNADAADKAAKGKAAKDYGTSEFAVELNEKGEYVPMEGAVSEYNEVWKDGQWVDTPESEQYFGPEGKKVSKEAAEKYGETRIKKAEEKKQRELEREEKNKGIRERNEARKYFKGKRNFDDKENKFTLYGPETTEGKVEALREIKAEQAEVLNEENLIDIEEQDDPDINYTTSSTVTPTPKPVVEENKTPTTTEKPKVSDFRTKKNAFGGTLTAKEQYEKALKEYYSKSPMEMRDNRIYRNAVKGGTVQQNMIKSGYKPE